VKEKHRVKCRFVGREYELNALQSLTAKQAASLVVVTGRRRIGKSRLVEEFAERNGSFGRVFISALAPQSGITPARQRDAFGEQMELALGLPPVQHDRWLNLFLHLARATAKGRWIILLDEVSWMACRRRRSRWKVRTFSPPRSVAEVARSTT
jgi:AAA+ ATPase superfamily predicted ATPase